MKEPQVDIYNSKVKMYNAHLTEINMLIKHLDQTEADITKLTTTKNNRQYANSPQGVAGVLNEVEVSNTIVRKE